MTTPRKDPAPTHKDQLAAHDTELARLREEIQGLRTEMASLRKRIVAQELLNPRLRVPAPEPNIEVTGEQQPESLPAGLPLMNLPRGWRA